jgi:TolA-binding protein
VTRIDLHPDELFDRLRAGNATASERERAQSHLQSCSACRLEQALLADADEAAAAPEAAEIAERARRRALAQLRTVRALGARGARKPAARRVRSLFAAALIAACFAAVALGRTGLRWHAPSPSLAPTHARAVSAAEVGLPSAPAPASAEAAPSALDEPESHAPEIGASKPVSSAQRAPEAPSASELFARANQARHQGDAREAATLYRSLERAFPKSAEANVARVTFGRLLLDRLGEPRAALAEFDAYLSAGGALREEALVGRALALGRRGRRQEERASWSTLLTTFPQSTYAARAQQRISELD